MHRDGNTPPDFRGTGQMTLPVEIPREPFKTSPAGKRRQILSRRTIVWNDPYTVGFHALVPVKYSRDISSGPSRADIVLLLLLLL